MSEKKKQSQQRLDAIVARARRESEERGHGYREQALKMYPWVCARCGREFNRSNLRELTVHHKNHDHDDNPPDGSNWELLCLYCHDNEHQRQTEALAARLAGQGISVGGQKNSQKTRGATFNPFADLKEMLDKDK